MPRVMRRNHAYGIDVEMVVWECPSCGIVYGIPKSFANNLRSDGGTYYCPNGHSLSWHKTDADRERERAEKAERLLRAERDTASRLRTNLETERKSKAAIKGHLTRARRRGGAGLCPVEGCKRHFSNVDRHLKNQHPGFIESLNT